MSTVVLLGFSTAGKSTIAKELLAKYGIEVLDSDKYVASGGSRYRDSAHIYDIYLEYGRDEALSVIHAREIAFLESVEPSESPRVIVAGPHLPSRDRAWDAFRNQIPVKGLYLTVTARDVIEGLRIRNKSAREVLSGLPGGLPIGFGSWDQGVTTEHDGERWVEVDDETARSNIQQLLDVNEPLYERNADQTLPGGPILRQGGLDEALAVVCRMLGVR